LSNVIIAHVPDPKAHTQIIELVTHNPEQTHQLGVHIGEQIQPGDVICLSGELGAGKTTLAGGIGRGWGTQDVVNSPTFVLVNEYSRAAGERLYHVDAYRLQAAVEAESIALPDLLSEAGSAMLIEWPERVSEYLPAERLWINLQWEAETVRRVRVEGLGARYKALVEQLSKT